MLGHSNVGHTRRLQRCKHLLVPLLPLRHRYNALTRPCLICRADSQRQGTATIIEFVI